MSLGIETAPKTPQCLRRPFHLSPIRIPTSLSDLWASQAAGFSHCFCYEVMTFKDILKSESMVRWTWNNRNVERLAIWEAHRSEGDVDEFLPEISFFLRSRRSSIRKEERYYAKPWSSSNGSFSVCLGLLPKTVPCNELEFGLAKSQPSLMHCRFSIVSPWYVCDRAVNMISIRAVISVYSYIIYGKLERFYT